MHAVPVFASVFSEKGICGAYPCLSLCFLFQNAVPSGLFCPVHGLVSKLKKRSGVGTLFEYYQTGREGNGSAAEIERVGGKRKFCCPFSVPLVWAAVL